MMRDVVLSFVTSYGWLIRSGERINLDLKLSCGHDTEIPAGDGFSPFSVPFAITCPLVGCSGFYESVQRNFAARWGKKA